MTGTRRGNGESSISAGPNKRGFYEAKVSMGTRPDGRPDRRHVERKTLAAVRKRVRELERERDSGQARGPGRAPTVREMLERHLDVVLPQRGRAPRTLSDYWSKCRNDIFPRWGGQRIDRLRPEHIEDGYSAMLAAGHAPGHVRKVHAILSSAYAVEVKRGNVGRNPCALVDPPRLPEPARRALSAAQARAVLATAAQRRDASRWAVGLACGLRQGEALGLRWSYVDLDAGVMRIEWQLQRLPWQHGCDDPARCGKRGADCPQRHGGGLILREVKERRRKAVPLPAELAAVLREHRQAQRLERIRAANVWEDHDFVWCQENGRPADPRADWQAWADILAAARLPHLGVHAMRHTSATVAIDQGAVLDGVRTMLGHSDVRVTEGYVHAVSPHAGDAAGRVGRALFGSTVPATVPNGSS